MIDHPRIWLEPMELVGAAPEWSRQWRKDKEWPERYGLSTEYIRADLVAAKDAEIARLRRIVDASGDNLKDAWKAMGLLREVVETLGPVGCMRSAERVCCAVAPTFDAEARELIAGIQRIADQASAAPYLAQLTAPLEAEIGRLRGVLLEIASQWLVSEIMEEDIPYADFETGYEAIVRSARSAVT